MAGKFVDLKTKQDSFVNLLTGLGDISRDKRKSTFYVPDLLLDAQTLEDLYHGNDLAARICNLVPDDAFRQGYRLKAGGDDPSLYSDAITGLLKQGRELFMDDKNHTANAWANVFGAGVLFLGAIDGNRPEEPLDETRIKSFSFLTVIERKDLTPSTWYSDPLSAKYGTPATYKINPVQIGNTYTAGDLYNAEIHESRLVIYPGTLSSRNMMQRNGGWPLSLLQRCSQVLFDFNTSWEFMSVLLQDVSQGIFKLDGLIEMIAEGQEQRLQQRMLITDMARSVGNSIMLDAEREDFRRETVNLGGIPEVLKEFQKRVSAAAGEPASLLFGNSPSGLGTSLEADIRWHYDKVKSHQEKIIRPRLERQYRLMMLAKDGPTRGKEIPDFAIEFEPLWQMSDKEEAELRKMQADADVLYINAGVLLPEEVTLSRFRPEGYSLETIADLDLRKAELTQPRLTSAEEPPRQQEALPPQGEDTL